MEKGCILPDNLLQKLDKESMVVYSLARFCECTTGKLLAVLHARNEGSEALSYGYRGYLKLTGKKSRWISIPCDDLKGIQENIKDRLAQIPVSLASTAGKPGDCVEKNAELHKYNPYLITMDIKKAYPSIDTHRVYKNLQGALTKPLKYWCPLLETDEDKDLFVRAITHLCVSQNELPQGASTSNQIQNIVMTSLDRKIEKRLPELVGSHMIYSRYADDLAISFPYFSTMEVLQEKMKGYIKALEKKDNDEFHEEKISALFDQFAKDTFIITDSFEHKYLQQNIEKIKTLLKTSEVDEKDIYKYVGIVDNYRKNIKSSDRRITDIQDEILKIIGGEGRIVNAIKTNMRNPQSDREREINGLTFDHQGNRGINKKRREQYMRLFNDLIKLSKEELEQNRYYCYKFKMHMYCPDDYISKAVVNNVVDGVYHYIASVYGSEKNIPKYLQEAYHKVKEKRGMDAKENIHSDTEPSTPLLSKFREDPNQNDFLLF